MRYSTVRLATMAGLAVTFLCAQPAQWKDPSPHRIQFVPVGDGVQLEVLDWGGSGRVLVLLAGSGNTAHMFDDFAVKLAEFCHVYGVTRRGYGASSHPESGYDAKRLGDDVLAVLDALHLDRPVLAGHSLGGHELTALATAHPSRVAGLIYMDSTSDPTFDWRPYMELRKKLPPAMAAGYPKASAEDRRSFQAYREWQRRNMGIAFPESELRNDFATNPDGSMGEYRTPVSVQNAITAGMRKPDYSGIRVPVLAFYTLPTPLESQMKRHQPQTAEERAAMKQVFDADVAWARRSIDRMRSGVPAARVVEMPAASHCIFLSNEPEVLLEIRQFVTSLP
jgi:non-heme chloroperoxidase